MATLCVASQRFPASSVPPEARPLPFAAPFVLAHVQRIAMYSAPAHASMLLVLTGGTIGVAGSCVSLLIPAPLRIVSRSFFWFAGWPLAALRSLVGAAFALALAVVS